MADLTLKVPRLEKLDLREAKKVTEEMLERLIYQAPHLQELKLEGCDRIQGREVFEANPHYPITLWRALDPQNQEKLKEPLLRLLRQDPSLTRLTLSRNQIGDVGAGSLSEALKENTTLTELNLRSNQIGDVGTGSLSEALKENTRLTELDLGDNKIGPKGAGSLSKALKQNLMLRKLNLRGNQIGDVGAGSLSEALKENLMLTVLKLWHNKIGDVGTGSLSDALKKNLMLTVLNLRSNGIGDVGAGSLSKALKQNLMLTELNLENNQIGPKGAASLSEALKENTTLTALDLGVNQIGPRGAASLSEVLKQNTTLTVLGLEGNQIGAVGAGSLSDALKENSTLTVLGLEGNQIGAVVLQCIRSCIKRNQSLLKKQPPLQKEEKKLGEIAEKEEPLQKPILDTLLLGDFQGIQLRFRESPIPKDGDCGFHALGLERGIALGQLLSLSHDPNVRQMMAGEIESAFLAEDLPAALKDQRYEALQASYFEAQETLDRIVSEVAGSYQLENALEAKALKAFLVKNNLEVPDVLTEQIEKLEEMKETLSLYCQEEEIYRGFIENDLNQGGWLGYVRGGTSTLDVLAQLNHLNVYVWTQEDGALKMIHEIESENPERTVHLHHTDNLTHFNVLEVQEEDISSPVVYGTSAVQKEEPEDERFYAGLSIDGGGMRGLIPALFLRDIEEATGSRIHELFDFVGGTSIGGILALGTGATLDDFSPIVRSEELVNLFYEYGSQIFSTSKWKDLKSIKGLRRARFDPSGLEHILQTYFGEILLSDSLIHTVVTTFEDTQDYASASLSFRPFLFDSRKAQGNEEDDFYMRDVGRATSSAPTYFNPALIYNLTKSTPYTFRDGGLWQNNPGRIVYDNLCANYKTDNVVMMSLGTGVTIPNYLSPKGEGALNWADRAADASMMLSAGEAHEFLQKQLGGNYRRLQPHIESVGDLASTEPNLLALYESEASKTFSAEDPIFRRLAENKSRKHPGEF